MSRSMRPPVVHSLIVGILGVCLGTVAGLPSRAWASATAGQAILASVINAPPAAVSSSPGVLSAELILVHTTGQVGDPAQFTLTVRNTGGTTVTNLTATLRPVGQAAVFLVSPTGPVDLVPGASQSFVWTVAPGESGVITMIGSAAGFTDTGSGSVAVSSTDAVARLPGLTSLAMNESFVFPSPAHGAARIAYRMGEAGVVRIRVYDAAGQLVDDLVETRPAGIQSTGISTSRFAPGVYFYLLERTDATGHVDRLGVKKFVVIH